MNPLIVFEQMVVIVLLILTGFICQKIGRVTLEIKKFLSFGVVSIFNPALLISSVLGHQGERDMNSVWIIFAVAAAMFAAFIIIAKIASFTEKEFRAKATLQLMFIFSNLGFIGIPLVGAVLGEEYIIYTAIFNLVYNVVFYSYGTALTDESGKKFSLSKLKSFINAGTIGGILALLIFFINKDLPLIFSESIGYLGGVCVPMALFIIGVTLGEQKNLVKVFLSPKLYLFFVVKMLLIPVAFSFVIKALPIGDDLKILTLLMVGMPVGNLPLMTMTEKGWDGTFCSNGIILTTLLSTFSLPVIVFIYNLI